MQLAIELEELKKEYEYNSRMMILEYENKINTLKAEKSLLQNQLENSKGTKTEYELYKEIESKFNEEKKKELEIIKKGEWLEETKDILKKNRDKICEDYSIKK